MFEYNVSLLYIKILKKDYLITHKILEKLKELI